MAFNGSGVFTVPNTFTFDTVISETEVNVNFADLAQGLSNTITRDGQTTVTANIPMSGFRFTGLSAGVGNADSVTVGQVQSGIITWAGTTGGTGNALTLSPSPSIGSYTAGLRLVFVANANNTGAVTLTVSGLAPASLFKDGADLSAGDIVSGRVYDAVYDGTAFNLMNGGIDIQFPLQGADLADNAVTTSKIQDGAVTDEKLASGVGTSEGNFAKLGVGGKFPASIIETGTAEGQIPILEAGGQLPESVLPSAGGKTVTLLSTRTTNGTWTITGVEIGEPLYVLASAPGVFSLTYVSLIVTSGSDDGLGGSFTFDIVISSAANGTGNNLIVIPTDTSVSISVTFSGSMTLRAYQ